MSVIMQAVQFPNGGFPEGDAFPAHTDQTFPAGTPVTYDTTDNALKEHALGATVTNIKGVSLDGVTAGAEHNPDGKVNFVSAARSNVFMAKLINGSGEVQTPDSANVNRVYGLLKVDTGLDMWFGVDESDTTDVHVEVIGYDLLLHDGVVFFKFIESAIQNP